MTAARPEMALAVASLRHRAVAVLAVFLAVAIGTALLVGCAGLFETALRLDTALTRLAGAPVVVGGPAGFALPDEESQVAPYAERSTLPVDAPARIAAVPGVERVVTQVGVPVGLPGAGGVVTAYNWSAIALGTQSLRSGAPPGAGQVVLDDGTARANGLRLGDVVRVEVGGRDRDLAVVGTVGSPAGLDGTGEPSVLLSDVDAAAAARLPGAVDLAGVWPRPGVAPADLAAALASRLGPVATVTDGGGRGAVEHPEVAAAQLPVVLLAAVSGGTALVVIALVVATATGLTVRHRRRELGLLRVVGATPRQVRRMTVTETMLVAVAGAFVGAVVGALVAPVAFRAATAGGLLPPALLAHCGPIAVAAAVLVTPGVAFAGVCVAARAAGRIPLLQVVSEEEPEPSRSPVRRGLAVLAAGATGALVVITPFLGPDGATATGGPVLLTGAIAVALVAPDLLRRAATAAGDRLGRRTAPVTVELALRNVAARASGWAAVLVPVVLATALALGNVYTQTTTTAARTAGLHDQFAADAVVSVPAGVTAELIARIREQPAVAAASPVVASRGWLEQPYDGRGTDPTRLLGIDAPAADGVLATPVRAGSLDALTGRTVALPADMADGLGITLGRTVTLRLGDGASVPVTVVALLAGSTYPSVVLPAPLLAAHTSAGVAGTVVVRGRAPSSPDQVRTAVATATAGVPGPVVGGADLLSDAVGDGTDAETWIDYLLAALAVGYATVAAVNALLATATARRREFGTARVLGATRRDVLRVLLVEAGFVASSGVLLGTGIAVLGVWPVAFATGLWLPAGPPWVLGVALVGVAVVVGGTTRVTAALLCTRRPVDAVAPTVA